MSLTLQAQPAPALSTSSIYGYLSNNHSTSSLQNASHHSRQHSSAATNAGANMTSALPNLFLKHARSHSLEKQMASSSAASTSVSSLHPSTSSSSHAQNGVNGHASTSTSTSSPSTIANGSANGIGTGSFIRQGDIVYDRGPPPPVPLPAMGSRNYTVLKEVGDGSFGTVWLADWHSPLSLPKDTGPPGPSSRPEYKGKRLVALKRMKKAFEGGWDECLKLKELKSLRSIPMHPNIIPLYDAFLLPSSKELYFVFECMEGNLYQLTKSRKGRPLASGLVADLFHQMLAGLHHIHESGYFHRDMKPENLLITTTGLADYPCYISPQNRHNPQWTNRQPEKDVVAMVKIADFGLARETRSRPPYTEYVSTRWYRAPEVLLRSRDYSNPVDMWALGTILAEMVTLKPLFPGQSEVDQVFRICEIMGDPSPEYGVDPRTGRVLGGGNWERGIKMAKSVGFQFPKIHPVEFGKLFAGGDESIVPKELVEIIQDLMRYDPKQRLTTGMCLAHPYFTQVAPLLRATAVPSVPNHVKQAQAAAAAVSAAQSTPRLQVTSNISSPYMASPNSSLPSPRPVPSSHSHQAPYAKPAFEPNNGSNGYSNGLPGLPPPSSSASGYSTQDYYSAIHRSSAASSSNPTSPTNTSHSNNARDRHASLANSLLSNDSHGFGNMHVHVGNGSEMGSPNLGYPESVIGDVHMDSMDEDHHQQQQQQYQNPHHQISQNSAANGGRETDNPSPVPSSIYSFGQGPSDSLPPPHASLPHPYSSSSHQHLPHPSRQGANGYAASTYSSYYNPSIYSNGSGDASNGGRRGSAGGASTFYDGSIFEGIAPTRAASILSFPASYGGEAPSPKFGERAAGGGGYARSTYSLPHNAALSAMRSGAARKDSDNFTVDFEREALQRSQIYSHAVPPVPQINHNGLQQQNIVKSDSNEFLKASKMKDGKSGGRGWMASVFSSNNNNASAQQHHSHPQQQPLVHPPNFPASTSASISDGHNKAYSIHSSSTSTGGVPSGLSQSSTSLKRTPSERSVHAPDLQQPPPQQQQSQQPAVILDPKKAKKEAERLAKEAEKAKREAAQKAARDRARAVMQKRSALAQAADPLHNFGQHQFPTKNATTGAAAAAAQNQMVGDKEKLAQRERAIMEARKQQQAAMANGKLPQISEDGRLRVGMQQQYAQHQHSPDIRYKARRRDDDDDVHSMSSNETRSERRFSISSHATGSTVSTTHTMDSDPGASRPTRNQLLPPVRRTPSVSSFGGHSQRSVGSQNSGTYSRRDLGTSSSNASSLEHGLVGRFQGLTAAEHGVSPDGRVSPGQLPRSSVSPTGHPHSPHYYSPSSASGNGHQQHAISLPPIQSFDHPGPPKEFNFGNAPRSSQSNHSNGSTISGSSQFISINGQLQHTQQGLPFTQEMYRHQLEQQQQGQR